MPRLSPVTVRYLLDFCLRLGVFLLVAVVYLLRPQWLDFTQGGEGWPVRLVLWVVVFSSMVVQLHPKSPLTTGCMKQYPARFDRVEGYDPKALRHAVRTQNLGALKVAAVWGIAHVAVAILYRLKRITVPTLVLMCAFYLLSDLICVLFFCPFQTFLMGNRCCVNCRIFAWGAFMMASPLAGVIHLYSQSLFCTGVLVLCCWEFRFLRHPERFWYGSNRHLQCANCQEQLCRYKLPRSPWVRGHIKE